MVHNSNSSVFDKGVDPGVLICLEVLWAGVIL